MAGGPIIILVDINGTLGLKTEKPLHDCPVKPAFLNGRKYLYCRPGCVDLLQALSEHPRCHVGIYTCWQPQNAGAAVQALGIQKYVFYTYSQVTDPRFAWVTEDRTRYNPKKRMYEWKKDVAKVLPHVSQELKQVITLANVILIDDTPDKTRDCSQNVIIPSQYDEHTVRRGKDTTLPALQAYLLTLLNSCTGDVRDYLKARPFDEMEHLTAAVGQLTLTKSPYTPLIDPQDRAGDHGSALQTLHSSQFRLWYDKQRNVQLSELPQHLSALLGLRKGRFLSGMPDVSTREKAIRLWSSEMQVQYCPKRGDKFKDEVTQRFYKFLNHEMRFDAHDSMEHVAFIVRVFNQFLAQPFTPRTSPVYRGATMPLHRVKEFFNEDFLGPHERRLRIPAFFATSYEKWSAEAFTHAKGDTVAVSYEIHLPERMLHACDISGLSEFPQEAEVLFPPYSLFEFVRLEPDGPGYRVTLHAAADNKGGFERVPCPMWQ